MGVLSCDQQAVADDMRCPVRRLREDGAEFQHLILDKERHDFGEADFFFLAIGEAGHLLTLNHRFAVRRLDVTQCPRGMTHDADGLAGGKEGLDQLDGVLVFGEIPHRAVAARIKDGVEVFLLDAVKANGLVELSFRSRVLLEPERKVSTEIWFVALGIERRAAAFRRCERDLDAGVLENVVGSSEFFESEARFSSGVTQLIV
jgi:hypothetical protein